MAGLATATSCSSPKKKLLFTTHAGPHVWSHEKKGWLFLTLAGPRLKHPQFSSCILWGNLSPSHSDFKYEFSIIPNHLSSTLHYDITDLYLPNSARKRASFPIRNS